MITGEIKSKIDKIWNDFWTGGIANPLTVIEQFTYLIFIKQLDDKQTRMEKQASLLGVPMDKPIYADHLKALRWSSFKHKDPEVLFDLFTKPQRDLDDLTAFDFIKTIGDQGGEFAKFMKGAIFMIPSAKLLDKVVQQIDTLPLDNRDTKGDLYEYMLSKIAEAGTNGQFRTPRHIINMMVEMVKPRQDDVICDPSCGTAGFLVSAGEYIYDNHKDWFTNKSFREHFNSNMFNGIEFDPSMLRIAAMNLQLHGIETPILLGKDALSEANADVEDDYTLILANPPFKGSLDYDAVESSLLQTTKTKKTELLFLSLMLRALKVGGRAAVIVPDGVLFGSSKAHKSIRQTLVEKQKLDAVISMPSGVFKPYAGVSTAILLFTKTNSGGTDNVWFYDMKADGYSLDDKRNAIKDNDIPDILQRWQTLRHPELVSGSHNTASVTSSAVEKSQEHNNPRTAQSFMVPFTEIKDNDWDLSINRYKEIVYEEIEYDVPEVIISAIEKLDKERNEALTILKEMLT